MHILVFEADHASICFGKYCESCTFPRIILGLSELQCKFICTSAYMSHGKPPLFPCKFIQFLEKIKVCSSGVLFFQILPSGS